jgi:hypothetical protein
MPSFVGQARRELAVRAGFLSSELKWLPLCLIVQSAPNRCKEFVSDAAYLALEADICTRPGCGNVGFCEMGKHFRKQICLAHKVH